MTEELPTDTHKTPKYGPPRPPLDLDALYEQAGHYAIGQPFGQPFDNRSSLMDSAPANAGDIGTALHEAFEEGKLAHSTERAGYEPPSDAEVNAIITTIHGKTAVKWAENLIGEGDTPYAREWITWGPALVAYVKVLEKQKKAAEDEVEENTGVMQLLRRQRETAEQRVRELELDKELADGDAMREDIDEQ